MSPLTNWVPLIAVPLFTALVVVVLGLAVAALRGRRPRRTAKTITKLVEAPDDPKIYFVLCMARLTQLYQQTPGAAFTTEREEEIETTASGGAGVASVKADIGQRSTSRERTTQNEVSPPQMAVAVERRVLSEPRTRSFDLITPGDDRPISALLEVLGTEAERIGLTVPDVVTQALEDAWREKSRSAPAPDLRSLGPLASVRAEFSITDGPQEGDRVLVATVWNRGSRSASVAVPVRRSDLAPPYGDPAELDRLGATVRATCLGVQHWRAESDTLELNPVYVYFS